MDNYQNQIIRIAKRLFATNAITCRSLPSGDIHNSEKDYGLIDVLHERFALKLIDLRFHLIVNLE